MYILFCNKRDLKSQKSLSLSLSLSFSLSLSLYIYIYICTIDKLKSITYIIIKSHNMQNIYLYLLFY